jgi:hypothetical protein
MGKWTEQFNKGLDTLIKAKIDPNKQMKNLNGFLGAVESCESLDLELLTLRKQIDEFEKKKTEFAKMGDAISKSIPEYNKALASLEKVASTTGSKEIDAACDQIRGGLNRIEGLIELDKKAYAR